MAARQYIDPCECATLHEEEEWVRELKKGTPQVKDDLWVVIYCYATTLPRFRQTDIDQKHDAALAAYLRIMNRGLYVFNSRGSFCGFVCAIVINEVYRRFPPAAVVEIELPTIEDGPLGADDPLLAQLDALGWLEALAACLAELVERSPLLHEVIHQFYVEGLKAADIARLQGKTPNHVYQLLHRGRLALQECLIDRGFTADTLPEFA